MEQTATSVKQIEANRTNGALGGVKTADGKAVSKYNALRHGILSSVVLLKGEDGKKLQELRRNLFEELCPATEIENILVERIIANTWRLRRAIKAEVEMIDDDMTDAMGGRKTFGQALGYDFANYDSYGKFTRYETALERGIYRALHELQRLQAARLEGRTTLPVVVDLHTDRGE